MPFSLALPLYVGGWVLKAPISSCRWHSLHKINFNDNVQKIDKYRHCSENILLNSVWQVDAWATYFIRCTVQAHYHERAWFIKSMAFIFFLQKSQLFFPGRRNPFSELSLKPFIVDERSFITNLQCPNTFFFIVIEGVFQQQQKNPSTTIESLLACVVWRDTNLR